MPTLAFFRTSRKATAGFSLLELLIVLALLATVTALVVPRLDNVVRAVRVSGARAEVERRIERLPLQARREGRAMAIGKGDRLDRRLGDSWPEGWSAEAVDGLSVAANGVCMGGRVRVRDGEGLDETWRLSPPDCSVDHGP